MKIIHYYKVASHFNIFTHEFWLALCHDLVEDGYVGKWILKYWKALDAITRRDIVHMEIYEHYIWRCADNKVAKRVKIADLEENMKRCSSSLMKRYEKAYKTLTQ